MILIISPFEFGCLEPWTVILISRQMLEANNFPPYLTLHKILNFPALLVTLPFLHWMNFEPILSNVPYASSVLIKLLGPCWW